MKFEYDEYNNEKECVAFIDDEGDLCVRARDEDGVYFTKEGYIFCDDQFDFYMKNNGCSKKFYKGDKITITF